MLAVAAVIAEAGQFMRYKKEAEDLEKRAQRASRVPTPDHPIPIEDQTGFYNDRVDICGQLVSRADLEKDPSIADVIRAERKKQNG